MNRTRFHEPAPASPAGKPGIQGQSRRASRAVVLSVFIGGLLVWIVVQGALTNIPLWTRALPPEFDDAIGYIVKTRQMEECFFQDCPALEDLRAQLLVPEDDPRAAAQQDLAATRIFPVYHFSYSLLLLGLKRLGLSLMEAHNLVFSLGPIFFGVCFAYLLIKVWGLPAAGPALGLMAFKVFPFTGLHIVQPVNLTMGLAVLIMARIFARQGEAPLTLILGSLLLVLSHPTGRIFTVMVVVMAVFLSGFKKSLKVWLPVMTACLFVALAFFYSAKINRPYLLNPPLVPAGADPVILLLRGAADSLVAIVSNFVNLGAGLFGPLSVLLGAVVLGFLTVSPDRRRNIIKILSIYAFFLLALLFYVSYWPAGGFYRLWIPFYVILFGAVGQALYFAFKKSRQWLSACLEAGGGEDRTDLARAWPVLILAVLVGYAAQTTVFGAEQIAGTIRHFQNRQPLKLSPAQPALLLSKARPGDRVLYTSMMIMPYYFTHGAMRLGAVYYHPDLRNTSIEARWLNRPDLRFAVTYNPTVYHPSFEGRQEISWWTSSPDFRYSPLSDRRTDGPLSREGVIPASDFRWIEVVPQIKPSGGPLWILIDNPGQESWFDLRLYDSQDSLTPRLVTKMLVPAGWWGWLKASFDRAPGAKRFRIVLPPGRPGFKVGGLVFQRDGLRWPWHHKAELEFMPRDCRTGSIKVSFDPQKMLPPFKEKKKITVLDDKGSSVLFMVDQEF